MKLQDIFKPVKKLIRLKPKRDTWFLIIKKIELEQLKFWEKIKHDFI